MAYLLTFSTYGTHLPGSEKGWVDASHRNFGSPVLAGNLVLEEFWRLHLKESPWTLGEDARLLALEAILCVCTNRSWFPHAIHVRTTHVHAVIGGNVPPEKMLSDFKAYATRAFRTQKAPLRRRYWTDHGSTRYLWNEVSLKAALDYVLHEQGAKLKCYPEATKSLTLSATLEIGCYT